MKGTKKIFTLLIFSVAVAFTGGCSSPIGSLLAESGATLEYIRAEPKRFVYGSSDLPEDWFIPKDDVDVFGIFGGKEKPIAIKDVKIVISGYPFSIDDEDIVLNEGHKESGLLLTSGIKNIIITYNGKETLYRISVGETETGEVIVGGDDGSGIEIKWEWPED